MTEERFTHDWSNDFKREVVTDHHNSDYEMREKQCCELLNKLNKENEELKSILKEIVRVSEYNGAISPMRIKSMTYNIL